jgi:hypothetical protein
MESASSLAKEALSRDLEETRKSEAKLRQVVDSIPAPVWSNLADGPNDFSNQRWQDYRGTSSEEARGWGWQAAVHPYDSNHKEGEFMERPVQSPTKGLSRSGPAEDESGLFSGGSVLKLQKLIFAGSPLSEVLTPCTHSTALSESKGQNVNPTRPRHGGGCD